MGAVEMGGGDVERAELGMGIGADKKERRMMVGMEGGVGEVGELEGERVGELAGREAAAEMDTGTVVIAELDGREVERMKSVRKKDVEKGVE